MRQGRIISFRITQEHYALLAARSTNGGSPGSYARELMLQALHAEAVVTGIAERLDRHEAEVRGTRRDVQTVLRTLLVAFAKLGPERAGDKREKATR